METYSPMGIKLRFILNINDGLVVLAIAGLIMIIYLNIDEFKTQKKNEKLEGIMRFSTIYL